MATQSLSARDATDNGDPSSRPAPSHPENVRALFRRNLEAAGLPTRYADNMREPDPDHEHVAECLVNAFLEADGITA